MYVYIYIYICFIWLRYLLKFVATWSRVSVPRHGADSDLDGRKVAGKMMIRLYWIGTVYCFTKHLSFNTQMDLKNNISY